MALPERWHPLRRVDKQQPYIRNRHRFAVVPSGRRSGKTEIAKRRLVIRAMMAKSGSANFFAAAPTREQAKRIFWSDLKDLVPQPVMSTRPSESELTIRMINGSTIVVVGMDKPERIEGTPWDGGILDELGNMKADTWPVHVRPALSDRDGWCDLIGVPEGRNHYYDIYTRAQAEYAEKGEESEWAPYHWLSADVLPAREIKAARRDLDDLSFQQEYEGSFINFSGRAYYPFDLDVHAAHTLEYDPEEPIAFCFDFNVEPGVAVICQEMMLPTGTKGTGVIGEVWIERNSNTPAVCRKLREDWANHKGPIRVYGDASGGSRGTAQVAGSDWELVEDNLRESFRAQLSMRVPKGNPPERARINAVNTRLRHGDGTISLCVDPVKAPHVVRDLDGVRLLDGGSGEIDKKHDKMLTHLSDALGYYIVYEFPLRDQRAFTRQMDFI